MLTILSLALLPVAQQPTCTQSAVFYTENFDHGVLPPGWSNTGWIFAQPPVCAAQCGSGFLATYYSTNCDCASLSGGCSGNDDLRSPPIALPALGPGQALVLDFCFEGFLDTFTGDCNQLEIEHAGGTTALKLGPNIVYPCPGPSFLPPFDLSPYAGQSIRLTWHAGSVDSEGDMRMTIDDVTIAIYDAFPATDCNANGLPDGCDLVNGTSPDCDGNLTPDSCDIASGASQDCNGNDVPDDCDLAAGTELDCDGDLVPDSCSIASGSVPDCNDNGLPDVCDIAAGTSNDFNGNGRPDECECTETHFYCTGGTNSLGKKAAIGFDGSTSITLNNLVLTVVDARPGQIGIFFMAAFKAVPPQAFGGGFLCATGNQSRLLPPVFLDATGAGSYVVDYTDPSSAVSTIDPLAEWNFQFWYRDPQPVGPQFNLTNAAHLHFCP